MIIDNVTVQADTSVVSEENLKVLVANTKIKFPFGRLSKIVVTANPNGGFDVDYFVKNQTKL